MKQVTCIAAMMLAAFGVHGVAPGGTGLGPDHPGRVVADTGWPVWATVSGGHGADGGATKW